MQKLAMMMAVMILGMSPAHGYSISADSGSLEVGGQAKVMSLLPRWYSDDGTLTARNVVSPVATEGYQPVEPGGYPVGRNLQQSQLRVEDWERIRNRILGLEPAAPKGTGTPGHQREENPVQITISKPKKSAKPTSDGEGRG